MMDLTRLALGLVFLGVCCASSIPRDSNKNEGEAFITIYPGAFSRIPIPNSLVRPKFSVNLRKDDSLTKMISNKKDPSEFVSCGNHTLEPGQTVNIKSQNYPQKYPTGVNCEWNFQGTSKASTISISCSDFKMKSCKLSSMTITGGDLYKKYCKTQKWLTETSSDHTMVILFVTGRSKKRGKGFTCTVSASDVPTTTTQESTSPTSSTTAGSSCKNCGTVNRVMRIVGGQETEVNEYPWQAAIVYAGTNNAFCGGTLLNSGLVVTAAQCIDAMFYGNIEAEVLLGAHDLNNPTVVQQRIGLVYYATHYLYDSSTLDNDIGMMWLSSPAMLSDNVKPVCLPEVFKDYAGYTATASGWGTLTEAGPKPNALNAVDLPIVSNEACNENYDGVITETMVCAGIPEGGKDACLGDSGGPLVTEDNGRWVLVGITSWGNGCGRPNFPGVYARVTEYVYDLSYVMAYYGSNNLCYGPTYSKPMTMKPVTSKPVTAKPVTVKPVTSKPSTNTTTPSGGCKCGRRNPVTRIVGGQETTMHEYPWQVGLTAKSQPYCGGSIISDQWILSAAHCVTGGSPSSVKVLIGEHDWTTGKETSITEKRDVVKIIIHPRYSSSTLDNDMALLKLSSKISFPSDNKIAPVCLPDPDNLYDSVDAVVTGWGTISSGGSQPSTLLEVTVPTMTNRKCKGGYGSSITKNMICAGFDEGGKDSCQGDSGGPLVTSGNNAETFMVQIGVVSWGSGCAVANQPGVYARVTNYLNWISSKLGSSETCPRP